MKIRTDLLEHLTDEDILETVKKNNHRYKPEPLFAQTGTGSLSTASAEEKEQEVAATTDFVDQVRKRATVANLPAGQP